MQTANGYQPTPTEVMSYWVDNMEKEARELFRRGLPLNTDIWDAAELLILCIEGPGDDDE